MTIAHRNVDAEKIYCASLFVGVSFSELSASHTAWRQKKSVNEPTYRNTSYIHYTCFVAICVQYLPVCSLFNKINEHPVTFSID